MQKQIFKHDFPKTPFPTLYSHVMPIYGNQRNGSHRKKTGFRGSNDYSMGVTGSPLEFCLSPGLPVGF